MNGWAHREVGWVYDESVVLNKADYRKMLEILRARPGYSRAVIIQTNLYDPAVESLRVRGLLAENGHATG